MRNKKWYAVLWIILTAPLSLYSLWVVLTVLQPTGGGPDGGFVGMYYGFLLLFSLPAFVLLVILFFFSPSKQLFLKPPVSYTFYFVGFILICFYIFSLRKIKFQVFDTQNHPLSNVTIEVDHSMFGGVGVGCIGKAYLVTNSEGEASCHIFKNENFSARVFCSPYSKEKFQDQNISLRFSNQSENIANYLLACYSWKIELHLGQRSDYIYQSYTRVFKMEDEFVFPVELLEEEEFKHLSYSKFFKNSDFLSIQNLNLKSLAIQNIGSTLDGISRISYLIQNLSDKSEIHRSAIQALTSIACQLSDIHGFILKNENSIRKSIFIQGRISTKTEREKELFKLFLKNIYFFLNEGNSSNGKIEASSENVQDFLQIHANLIIQGLAPYLLEEDVDVFNIFNELGELARSSLKYYPEVFRHGSERKKEQALRALYRISPSPQEMMFLIKSKNEIYIDRVAEVMRTRKNTALEDLKFLLKEKSIEKDAIILRAYDLILEKMSSNIEECKEMQVYALNSKKSKILSKIREEQSEIFQRKCSKKYSDQEFKQFQNENYEITKKREDKTKIKAKEFEVRIRKELILNQDLHVFLDKIFDDI